MLPDITGYREWYTENRKEWMLRNWMHVNYGYSKKVDKYKLYSAAIDTNYPFGHENDVSQWRIMEIAQEIIDGLIETGILDENAVIVDSWYADQEILYNKY